ncbi:hypothetical protein AB5N19_02616 [Seiridium cardinale]
MPLRGLHTLERDLPNAAACPDGRLRAASTVAGLSGANPACQSVESDNPSDAVENSTTDHAEYFPSRSQTPLEVVMNDGQVATFDSHWSSSLSKEDCRSDTYCVLCNRAQIFDEADKYARMLVAAQPPILDIVDKFGAVAHSPGRMPGAFDGLEGHPPSSEAVTLLQLAVELVSHGKRSSEAMFSQNARSCEAISRSLRIHEKDASTKYLEARAIKVMALVAVILQDSPAWQLHMHGLKQYLSIHYKETGTNINNTLSYIDIEGAILFQSPLFFSFSRTRALPPSLLPTMHVANIIACLRPRMRACFIAEDTTDTVIAVSIFTQTIRHHHDWAPEDHVDPISLMEDDQGLQHQLLTSPDLLWDDHIPEGSSGSCSLTSLGCSLAGHPYCPDFLGKAIRLTALMCIRAPTLKVLFGRFSYTALLNCLHDQLQLVFAWLAEAPRRGTPKGARMINWKAKASARPILIWICIIGHSLCTYFDVFHRGWSYRSPERSIYFRILHQLSVRSEMDVEKLREADLEICRILSLDWTTDTQCDGRTVLKRIINIR